MMWDSNPPDKLFAKQSATPKQLHHTKLAPQVGFEPTFATPATDNSFED